ncbi:MAG: hypothetical protein F6K48_06290 [Okeania sp. SIO3H1]|nr:hypothetical protein [Okeania sp. SIO3H1]
MGESRRQPTPDPSGGGEDRRQPTPDPSPDRGGGDRRNGNNRGGRRNYCQSDFSAIIIPKY